MKSKLPIIKGIKLLRIINKIGFRCISIKGSHHICKHSDGRRIVIPCHSNEELGRGLLNSMIKNELKITKDDFIKLLKK